MAIVSLNAAICFQKTGTCALFADGMKVQINTAVLSMWKTICYIKNRWNYIQINCLESDKILSVAFPHQLFYPVTVRNGYFSESVWS